MTRRGQTSVRAAGSPHPTVREATRQTGRRGSQGLSATPGRNEVPPARPYADRKEKGEQT